MKRLLSYRVLVPSLAILTALLYLAYSLRYGFLGFPLDDAWIHQTYARNLALHHQFAYNPGTPSVGSTSPLWTLLLAPSYLLRVDYRIWTYLLGVIFLASTGWILHRLSNSLFPNYPLVPTLTSAFCLLEWHLAWAAFSGMETILFVFLSLLSLERHLAGERPFLSGVIAGLLALTRPEGAILPLLLTLDTLWRRKRGDQSLSWPQVARHLAILLVSFGLLISPYLAFNLAVTGQVFPNTFYAKHAEYREILATRPLWVRWAQMAGATIVGAQVLLIPGCLYAAYEIFKLRRGRAALPLIWWFALVTIYAVRLPVTYPPSLSSSCTESGERGPCAVYTAS
jgi:hypothetical protein